MASSTRLSRRPMRRSPLMILMMYLASSAVARRRRSSTIVALGRRAGESRNFTERSREFSNGQRTGLAAVCPAKQVLRGRAKISMAAISGSERNFRLTGNLSQGTPEQCAANLQGTFFPHGEGAPGKKDRPLVPPHQPVAYADIRPPDGLFLSFSWWRLQRQQAGRRRALCCFHPERSEGSLQS